MTDWIILGLRILAPLLLYLFLGLILYQLVIATKRKKTATACLRSLENPGQTYILQAGASVGRNMDNTIVLADESVSAYHARFNFNQNRWWIEDLGSTNGAKVNSRPVQRTQKLNFGDIISLGNINYQLERGS